MRTIIKEADALVTITYRMGIHLWMARGKYVQGRGFEIDVFRDGQRFATNDGAWPSLGEGSRDVALISETLDHAIKEVKIGNLEFV